jgi:putative transposase
MPRRARVVVPGLAHHITQRGNNQRQVFDTDFDRKLFLQLLGASASKCGLAIWGYCLMTNHFHLIAVPKAADSLARTISRLEAGYARYLNLRRGVDGHLWQARYHSTPMDDRYRWVALAYVERNPVRAGMVGEACEYQWSSAGPRLGLAASPEWLQLSEWHRHWTREDWRGLLSGSEREQGFSSEMRNATLRGTPLGSELAERLEGTLGIRLRPGQAGRPKNERQGKASSSTKRPSSIARKIGVSGRCP